LRDQLEKHLSLLKREGDNKPTARPTAYMVTWKFKGVPILCLGGQRQLAKPLTLRFAAVATF